MTELDLLGPRASGESLGSAVLKAVAEDFQVEALGLDDSDHMTQQHAAVSALELGVGIREVLADVAQRRPG